jgi:hypothetical protein
MCLILIMLWVFFGNSSKRIKALFFYFWFHQNVSTILYNDVLWFLADCSHKISFNYFAARRNLRWCYLTLPFILAIPSLCRSVNVEKNKKNDRNWVYPLVEISLETYLRAPIFLQHNIVPLYLWILSWIWSGCCYALFMTCSIFYKIHTCVRNFLGTSCQTA